VSLLQEIDNLKPQFSEMAKAHGVVDFTRECLFAKQALEGNSFLASIAAANKQSLFNSILNVASIGISLNPALKRAYLVPRNQKIILDISYMGLCHIAQESGSVLWVQAEMVFSNDEFIFNGMGEKPTHKFNPFAKKEDRGEFIGAYCLAKTATGDYLTTMMNAEEIDRIKEKSDGWKAHINKGKQTIWVTDFGEMAKKTVVKRASKMWPKNSRINSLDEAIEVDNQNDELPVEEKHDVNMPLKLETIEKIKLVLTEKCKDMSPQEKGKLLIQKCKVKSFNDLMAKKQFELDNILLGLEVEW
jgi:recombination protein RecT